MKNGLYIILAFVFGWALAQLTKIALALGRRKKLSLAELVELAFKSGGMPSGHAASFTAAALTIGFAQGFDSAIFALAVCTEAIILYDAVNVRHAVGKQGKVLNKLVDRPLKVVEGHTVLEVAVGMLVGLASAVIVVVLFGQKMLNS